MKPTSLLPFLLLSVSLIHAAPLPAVERSCSVANGCHVSRATNAGSSAVSTRQFDGIGDGFDDFNTPAVNFGDDFGGEFGDEADGFDAQETPDASTDDITTGDGAIADPTATDDTTADDASATDFTTADDATTSDTTTDDTTTDDTTTDDTESTPQAEVDPPVRATAPPLSNAAAATCPPAINDATVNLIKDFEGFVPSPDPDPIGLPTVGFGHLCQKAGCSEVPFSFPLSQATAAQLLQSDVQTFTKCVNDFVSPNVSLNDNQFGALTSFAFNLGCGNLQSSTLLKRLNAGEDPNTVAAQEIPKFNKAGGKVLAGLTRRRNAEVALFQTASSTAAHPCN